MKPAPRTACWPKSLIRFPCVTTRRRDEPCRARLDRRMPLPTPKDPQLRFLTCARGSRQATNHVWEALFPGVPPPSSGAYLDAGGCCCCCAAAADASANQTAVKIKDAEIARMIAAKPKCHSAQGTAIREALKAMAPGKIEARLKVAASANAAASSKSKAPAKSEAQIKAAFAAFDENGDGKLSKEEVIAILTKKTKSGKAPLTAQAAEKMFRDMDKDGNGVVDYSEFAAEWATDAVAKLGVQGKYFTDAKFAKGISLMKTEEVNRLQVT